MIKFKILFLFFLLVLISCNKENPIEENTTTSEDTIISKNYLIDIASQWTVRRVHNSGAPFPNGDDYYFIDTTVYYFEGDTLLSKLTVFNFDSISNSPGMHKYNILHYFRKEYKWCLTYQDPSSSPGTLTTSYEVADFIRQDTLNKRVYVVRNGKSFYPMLSDEKEYVLYDFSLNATDTLPYNAWNGGLSNIYRIDSVKYVIIDGKKFKEYKSYMGDVCLWTIIEGIGSLNSFLRDNGQLIHFENSEIDFYP